MKTYTDTTEREKSVMDICAFLVPNAQPPMLVKPGDGSLDLPAKGSESTSMFGIAACDERAHLAFKQLISMRIGIVRAVGKYAMRPAAWMSTFAPYGWNRVDEGNQLGDVVLVGSRDGNGKRNPVAVRDDMMLGTGFAPIRGIRACLVPPKTARTLDESTIARSQSIWSAPLSLASSASWTRCHTPRAFHLAKRLQQVIPQPQPISLGKYSHGMPVRRTKRMPSKAMRLGTGVRPRVLGGLTGGRRGSISVHSSSGKIARAIHSSMQPVILVPNPLALCKIDRHEFKKL